MIEKSEVFMSDVVGRAGAPVIKAGDIALALAGRDEGRLFAVVAVDAEDEKYVLIADGRSRRADKPKRKKIKHLKLMKEAAFEIRNNDAGAAKDNAAKDAKDAKDKEDKGDKLTNAALRKIIAEYKNLQKS